MRVSRTVLHWAAKQNHFKIVEFLLSIGADAQMKNNDGNLAAQLTNDELIKNLLKFGLNLKKLCNISDVLLINEARFTTHRSIFLVCRYEDGYSDSKHICAKFQKEVTCFILI